MRLRNFDDAYAYLREHHGTSHATSPYCEDCGLLAPCPVQIVLDNHDRLGRQLRDATDELVRLRAENAALRAEGGTMNETPEQLARWAGLTSDDPWERRAWAQRDVLDLIDLDREDLAAPEDGAVAALCERIGYGAVMDAAARLWADRPRDLADDLADVADAIERIARRR